MSKSNSPNDNVEIIYNEQGESLGELLQKVFDIYLSYLKVGSYQINKGVKHDV